MDDPQIACAMKNGMPPRAALAVAELQWCVAQNKSMVARVEASRASSRYQQALTLAEAFKSSQSFWRAVGMKDLQEMANSQAQALTQIVKSLESQAAAMECEAVKAALNAAQAWNEFVAIDEAERN